MVSAAPPIAVFVAIGLAIAVAVAATVLRPLWRGARTPALALGAGVLLSAGLLYVLVGAPAALEPQARQAPETMEQAIAQLEATLEREPQQVEGWRLLARAYAAQGRAGDAAAAFARAVRLLPDDPDLLVEAAQAAALAREDRVLDAQAVAWLDHALSVEPAHQRARWFRGIAYRQSGDAAAAARTWEPLLAQVDPATSASLRVQVDAARAEAGLPPLPAAPATGDAPGAITVSVDVAPALRARIPADAVLYVIARPAGGDAVPVAVERRPASGFPVQVVLDDADSLMPTARLSQAGDVSVVARISASGDASAQPGDLQSAPVAAAAGEAVAATIDRVVE